MKNNLNGHYCLATKEHYDKLVEDGYKFQGNYAPTAKYYFINKDNKNVSGNEEIINMTMIADKPMHLHNGQWVFGSLEHKEDFTHCSECEALCINSCILTPEQPKRITREEAKDCPIGACTEFVSRKCKANQKDK